MLAIGRHADPVHARRPAAVHLVVRVAEKLRREVMGQGGEPLVRRPLRPMGDAFSSRVRVVFLLCCKGRADISPLKPWTAFPLYAAFPRSEYYAVLRLLPARWPPSGWAWGGAYACATPGGLPCSPVADFRHAALSDPAEVTASSPIPDACCCLPGRTARRPSDNKFTRLYHFTRMGCGLVVALSTLRDRPRGRPRKTRFAVGGWPFGRGNCTRSAP